jgi:hypothetical protein
MNIGIEILAMHSEFNGMEQEVKMVRVRDVDHPEDFGLASLAPEDSFAATQMTAQEWFDSALTRALRQLKEKKAAAR